MSSLIFRVFSGCLLVLLWVLPTHAVVEIGLLGKNPVAIEDVYQREGQAFVAIDDVLAAVELEGQWDSVAHIYRIRTPHGTAIISPGSQFLRLGDNFVPVSHRPRFIDGKLRVSEAFILRQLASLLSEPLYYTNHNPTETTEAEDPLERLFAFLLRKKAPVGNHGRRIVALDPGHGGKDPGALGLSGSKEKDISLAVSRRLEKLLKMTQDAPVVVTRNDDYAVDLNRRMEIIGVAEADAMLSLHAQSFTSGQPEGVMLFVQSQVVWKDTDKVVGDDASMVLAKALHASLSAAGFPVHEVLEAPVLPLGQGDLPRVLVEMGSLANESDLAGLNDPTRQQDLARALFEGLQQFFRSYKETVHEYLPEEPARRPEG